jgi:hypothetical protein
MTTGISCAQVAFKCITSRTDYPEIGQWLQSVNSSPAVRGACAERWRRMWLRQAGGAED